MSGVVVCSLACFLMWFMMSSSSPLNSLYFNLMCSFLRVSHIYFMVSSVQFSLGLPTLLLDIYIYIHILYTYVYIYTYIYMIWCRYCGVGGEGEGGGGGEGREGARAVCVCWTSSKIVSRNIELNWNSWNPKTKWNDMWFTGFEFVYPTPQMIPRSIHTFW